MENASTENTGTENESQGWILDGKLTPPAPVVSLVERVAALRVLDEGAGARLTLLVSPPGFGKTTLLAQWMQGLRARGLAAGWVSMDEGDCEPLQLLSCMTLALARGGVDMGGLEKSARQDLAEIPVGAALSTFLGQIGGTAGRVTLILDDFHRGQSRDVNAFMDTLVARAPRNLQLVIGTRERPSFGLASLRAQGLLQEIGADTLTFRREEACGIFDDLMTSGLIDGADVDRLVTSTEGWAVALQLARLWLGDDRNRVGAIEEFSGRTADVADYLAEQVFNTLGPEDQNFLLETAILERVNGDLANAVTGRDDCWDLLARLEKLNVLLVPLDSERRWFRYHHLFRDFLEDQLRRRPGNRIPDLHRAASRWFVNEGQTGEAVRHANLAGDPERVAEIIENAGGWHMVVVSGAGRSRAILRGLSEDLFFQYPRIGIARAYLHIKDGELAESHALMDALRIRTDDFTNVKRQPDKVRRDAWAIGLVLEGYEDRWTTPSALDRLRAVENDLKADDDLALGLLFEAQCVASLRMGEVDHIPALAARAIRHMRAAGTIAGLNYARFHMGLGQTFKGDLREAEATLQEASRTAAENFGAESTQQAIADVLLAHVVYIRGDVDEARRQLRSSLAFIEDHDSWFDILVTGYDVGSSLALLDAPSGDGFDAALAILARGEITARNRGLGNLDSFLKGRRLRLLMRGGAVGTAADFARSLDFPFRLGAWREHPHLWRSHHEMGKGLIGFHLSQGAVSRARDVVADIRASATSGGRRLHLIQALLMEALVERQAGRGDEAFDALLMAATMAMPEGAVRLFLDEGAAMETLIRQGLRSHRDALAVRSLHQNFLTGLLAAFEEGRAPAVPSGPELSPREMEVVVELAQGHSNKAIARTLDMTENTVKFHLKNIYAKLGVEKRGMAVAEARRLNLVF
ncbi:MAG: LuxR C-terminal-related transcriptional regulator [Sphingomonadales bacterium]